MKTVSSFLVKFCIAVLIVSTTPVLVDAQITSVSGETRNNTTTTGNQEAYFWSLRTVAVQPDGGYIAVWMDDTNDGSGSGIYGQRFNADGSKAGTQFLVNTTTSGSQFSPSLSVAPDGSFLVAWQGPGSSLDVFAQKFTKDGVKDGTEFLLNTSISSGQQYPEIQYYPDGTFLAAFIDGSQTVLQRFDTDNRTIGPETRITSVSGAVVMDGICVRPDNSVVVFWTAGADVYAKLFDYNLNAIGAEKRLNTYTTGTQQYVLGRVDAAGNMVFVWESDGQDGSGNGVYYRRYDNNFNALSASEIAVTTNTTGDQFGATVGVEPGGRFIISWTDNNNRDGGGGSPLLAGPGASIWFQEFNAAGTKVGAETRINQTVTGYQAYSLVDVNASGRLVFTWEGNGTLAGNIDDYGSYSRAFQFSQTGITAALTVSPTSVIASDIVTVTMTLTSASSITNVIPNPLSVSGTNGVFATLVSGPSPASATVGITPVNFTWTYKITAQEQTGTLTFGGNARTTSGVIFPYNTSNTISVRPALFVTDMTAPNLICDANLPTAGPQVFTIGARVTNAGLTNLTNVNVYLGNGTTPGTFPQSIISLAQTNNTYQGTFALIPMGGTSDCSRSLVSLGAAKNVIAGSIDFNGDGLINAFDDGVLSNGKTVIDGRIDVNLNGSISTADDYVRPPGVFNGYREPGIIDGSVDTNNDGVINASDNSTYGGESKVVYWQVRYAVQDAYGQPTYGNGSDLNDDLRYRWNVWVTGLDGATMRTDELKEFAKVRTELSAAANKIVPNPDGFISGHLPRIIGGAVDMNSDGIIGTADDGTYYGKTIIDGRVDVNNSGTITTADDGVINTYFPVIDGYIDMMNDGIINAGDAGLIVVPGQTVSITFNNATFGNVVGGFDENRDNLFDFDMWHQPIGTTDWAVNSLRLVDIKSYVTGSGGSNPLNGITNFYDNEPYLSRLIGDLGGVFNITYTYTFLVTGYERAVLTPYQEAASGSNNEKYNNDFPTVGISIMSIPYYAVLPSTGLKASATLQNNTANVNWKTETELNTDHFIVERSFNGSDFSAIATVEANGNSVTASQYQYPDNLNAGNQKVIYYRIKQVDTDGKSAYSNIVPVRLATVTNVAVWPNPFTSAVSVSIHAPQPDIINLSVYDMNGKLVKSKNQSVFAGNNQLQLNGLDALPAGMYSVNVSGALIQKSILLKKS